MDIVDQKDLRAYVAKTLQDLNDAVWDARGGINGEGVEAELPNEVKFEMVVLYAWQDANLREVSETSDASAKNGRSSEIAGGSTTNTSIDKQTGSTTDTGLIADTSQKQSTGSKTSNNANQHIQTDSEKINGQSE